MKDVMVVHTEHDDDDAVHARLHPAYADGWLLCAQA